MGFSFMREFMNTCFTFGVEEHLSTCMNSWIMFVQEHMMM